MSFLTKLFGDPNKAYLKEIQPYIDKINEKEEEQEKLSNQELKEKFSQLKDSSKNKDDLIAPVFSLVREASKRTLEQRHYDCQLQAGIALHQGKAIEMKTGEGKTLAATLAATLNSLRGTVHIVTVNDYLARRDAVWMGQIYHLLGLSVAVLNHQKAFIYDPDFKQSEEDKDEIRDRLGNFKVVEDFLRPCDRKKAYQCDIVYGTNNEFGFDYLRDNMVYSKEQKKQPSFDYVIIDEIDSILIDEARTPLIISQPEKEDPKNYRRFASLASQLQENKHYNVDRKKRQVDLTADGITKVEKKLDIDNLYHPEKATSLHKVTQALKAKELFIRDEDYITKEGEVVIVDQFTGRLMPGRRYSEGLHQAIEAKERVTIKPESKTLATVTFQNLFRMYDKLSGMTGTAVSAAEEFQEVYGLETRVIPTHKPNIREDKADAIYQSEEAKFKAIARKVKELNQKEQPVLIGTTSIEKSEYLGKLLQREGLNPQILNAKKHEKEAEIIAQAGRPGKVTVATNMAGRGVDIKLGGNPPDAEEKQKVIEAGGLFVIGSERHESRRIDNQLRGRAARQGEPGASQFFIALKNELFPESKNIIARFGGARIENLMQKFNFPEDQAIENKFVSKAVESAQKKVEGQNFDLRKRLLEYDDVIHKHRQRVYKEREFFVKTQKDSLSEVKDYIFNMIEDEIREVINIHTQSKTRREWNVEEIFEDVATVIPTTGKTKEELFKKSQKSIPKQARKSMLEYIVDLLKKDFSRREKKVGSSRWLSLAKNIALKSLDQLWVEHLTTMDHLKQSVGLRAYGQRDPLVEYKREGHRLFQKMIKRWKSQVVRNIFKVKIKQK